jgi:aldehyde dehydrogenase (NAD+)
VAPIIACGNSVVALASTTHPYPSILLGEMLATSDLPGGVVNFLCGDRAELIPTFASHEQIRGLFAVVDAAQHKILDLGAAESVKRVKVLPNPNNWADASCQGLEWIRSFVESKTTWHPVGV